MTVIIHVQSINDEEEITLFDSCFIYWGYKHPILLLWLFICIILFMAIIISENN